MHRCLNQELLYEHSSHFIFDVAEWVCEKGQGRSPAGFGVIFSPVGGIIIISLVDKLTTRTPAGRKVG